MSKSSRYIQDTVALPPTLVSRARAALGGYYEVVTFRSGGPLTKTEQRLGRAIALDCRKALSEHWLTQRSVRVYMQGGRRAGRMSRAETSAIRLLSERGHSAQAIADVLGLSATSVSSSPARSTHSKLTVDGTSSGMSASEYEASGTNILRKRLGKAHPFTNLSELANCLGLRVADVRQRARQAGMAYAELLRARAR